MMSSASPSTTRTLRPRKWDVIHACNNARQIADLLDAQATANIRAYVLSRARLPGDSLLQSWSEVRRWRSQLDDHRAEPPFDSAGMIVHAHSFTAGMAAIRGELPAVYDLRAFIDQLPFETTRSWLTRSFRAAEQFVLAQSAAVVVHDHAMLQACVARGAAGEATFLVPDATPLLPESSAGDGLRGRLALSGAEIAIYVESIDPALALALLAYRNAGQSIRLLLSESASLRLPGLPQADQLAHFSVSISPEHTSAAVAASDLVIASSEAVLACAMTFGKPSIAKDCEPMRSLSPEGAGLVWYREDDAEDRARRLQHLLREAEFRDSLADAARRFITSTRSLERVGKMFEEVYRFASERRRRNKIDRPKASLIPVAINP